MNKCLNCMQDLNGEDICQHCGFSMDIDDAEVYQLPPGTELHDKYILGTVIGFGGFGVVYKAWDKALCRVVAIKEYFPTIYLTRTRESTEVIVFDKKNSEIYEKGKSEFLDEARNIAKFNTDPNIVHIYDFFEANGTAYFVMEYLDGFTLKNYINEATSQGKVFSCESALYVAREILIALGKTHKEGIIHRDVKPANIYILPDGTVKLFDFGAARFYDENIEKTRTVIITPGYAAPEQYQIKSKQGPYTDIYAVGSILYEMLTGIKVEESVNRKARDEVVKPSEINGNIPEAVSNAVMRAIAVQPEVRFKDTKEFLDVLGSKGKVRDAKAQIKHKEHIRNLIILATACVVLLIAGYVGLRYLKNYRNAVLTDTSLVIAVPVIDDSESETEEMYRSMLSEFEGSYPQVTVALQMIDPEDYSDEITDLLKSDKAPDIMVYSKDIEISKDELGDVSSLFSERSYSSDQLLFLEDNKDALIACKGIPLTFEVPIVYENQLHTDLSDSEDYESYLNDRSNYIGTSSDYTRIQEEMVGVYSLREELYSGKPCEFTTWVSVRAGLSEEGQAAASRIMMYFLSDNAQEALTIDHELDFPINKNVWDEYIQINDEFAFLNEQTENMKFEIGN